jgi:AcrR family transcriptional regulator
MPRTLDPAVHAVRRDAFVDAAQRLIQAKGYEQMSIQDILDEFGASRGAFYHYFDSKGDLLEAVVDHMSEAVLETLAPMLADPDLPAVAKLGGVFAGIARWKGERTELMLALIQTWMADDNAIVREKFRRGLVPRLAPVLASIIHQGRVEGTFQAEGPAGAEDEDAVARVAVSLIQGLNEAATDLFFARQAGSITFEEVERIVTAYSTAFERVLGLDPGSFPFVDRTILRQWFG